MTPSIVTRHLAPVDILDASRILEGSPECGLTTTSLRLLCRERGVIGHAALFAGSRCVVGLMAYRIRADHYHLLTLAVLPSVRRMGVGSALVGRLVEKLSPGKRSRIVLECDDHNDGGIVFWRALGFRATGLVRDGAGEGKDAIRFAYSLPVTSDLREPGEWCATGREHWEC